MIRYLFYFFLAYTVYQLVFKFIIPLYRTTRQVKKGFREMQERMNGQMQEQQNYYDRQVPPQEARGAEGDYIEFEEIPPNK